MKKIVFGTFICSFAASTLAIFSIDKLQGYPFEKSNKKQELKISNKNITLFARKEEPKELVVAKALPVETKPLHEIVQNDNEFNIALTDEQYLELANEILTIDEEDILEDLKTYADLETPNEDLSDINVATYEDKTYEAKIAEIEKRFSSSAGELVISGLSISDEENIELDNYKDLESKMRLAVLNNAKNKNLEIENANKEKDISSTFEEVIKEEPINIANAIVDEPKEEIKNALIPIQRNGATSNEAIQIATEAPSNTVAMTQDGSASLKSMITKEEEKQESTKPDNNNPWVVAQGTLSPTNPLAKQEDFANGDEAPVSKPKSSEMVRNILIPIPEDILKENNLTPQLISSERNKNLQEKIDQSFKERNEELASNDVDTNTDEEGEDTDKKGKKTIFDSISSIFTGKTPVVGVSKKVDENFDRRNTVYSKKTPKGKKNNKVTKILPTEIKLSFQPNRAEISGQTLKWIEAFGNKTKEDATVFLEVRIDGTSSFELQQKRLSLLHNILTNKGVEYSKINTVFTTREPNSFIIRTVRISDKATAMNRNQKVENNSKYYSNW